MARLATCTFERMLRIAYLISRYPAISHTFILREVTSLRARGVEVETASINPPDRALDSLSPAERAEATRTYCLKAQGIVRIAGVLLRTTLTRPLSVAKGIGLAARLGGFDVTAVLTRLAYLAEAILVGDWMLRRKLEHLHVHFATPAATVALLMKEVFGLPFSMTVHGPDEFYNVDEYHLEQKIEGASFICCIGSFCRSQLMKLSHPREWGKFEVSPLGVDAAEFPFDSGKTTRETFRILCVGRLVPAKGQGVLVHAAHELRRRGRKIEVSFAGDGPDRARLEALAAELRVEDICRFLGPVNPNKVRELYAASDVFVLPSFAEGIPVVLMEAMAMGVPCVSTAITGIPELIESGRQGILVPPSDVSALCGAIEALMGDESLRRSIATAARDKVVEKYNLTTNVGRLESVFRARLAVAA